MKRNVPLLAAAGLVSVLSISSAHAQSAAEPWTGVYVGGSIGMSVQPNDGGSTILFDTDQDGTFNDAVNTSGGADAFSPGFCGGKARGGTAAEGCRKDKDKLEYFGHVGFDKQMGSMVLGIVGEFGKSDIKDSTSGFSVTPASYTFTRSMKYNAGLRLRAGFTPNGSTLVYATGGGAYGKIKHRFESTNVANSFTGNGSSDAWGYSVGGGVEQMLGTNFSVGLQYLYTSLKDDDYEVRVGPGSAPPTNPFLLVDPTGTDIRRSDDKFNFHSIRATASYRF